jgi:hypothetical protein
VLRKRGVVRSLKVAEQKGGERESGRGWRVGVVLLGGRISRRSPSHSLSPATPITPMRREGQDDNQQAACKTANQRRGGQKWWFPSQFASDDQVGTWRLYRIGFLLAAVCIPSSVWAWSPTLRAYVHAVPGLALTAPFGGSSWARLTAMWSGRAIEAEAQIDGGRYHPSTSALLIFLAWIDSPSATSCHGPSSVRRWPNQQGWPARVLQWLRAQLRAQGHRNMH